MAKGKSKLPGSIYRNKNRWWWKVKLPGESRMRARPLKPVGAKSATTDRNVAEQVAQDVWQQPVFDFSQKVDGDSVAALAARYLKYAKRYYRDADAKTTREPENIRYAVTPLVESCPTLPAEEFGPLKLKEVRKEMIERGWCRNVVNQRIGIIKRMFRWAASEQLIPPSVYHGLQTVVGLKSGRSGARETEPVSPVAESHVRAVFPYTTPVVAAMMEFQLLTGMRSTEVCIMKPKDIEVSGKICFCRPSEHKTKYRGHERTIAIGPRAQRILKPFLKRKLTDYCFSPAESQKQRTTTGGKAVQERYDRDSYRRAVQYGIRAARKAGLDVPDFHPHQLRHTAATRIRKEMGLDAAGAMLGHRNLKITDDYAELDKALASEAALKFG